MVPSNPNYSVISSDFNIYVYMFYVFAFFFFSPQALLLYLFRLLISFSADLVMEVGGQNQWEGQFMGRWLADIPCALLSISLMK